MTPGPAKATETTPRPKTSWRPHPPAPMRPPERREAPMPKPPLGNAAMAALARAQPTAAISRPTAPAGASNVAIVAATRQTPAAGAPAGPAPDARAPAAGAPVGPAADARAPAARHAAGPSVDRAGARGSGRGAGAAGSAAKALGAGHGHAPRPAMQTGVEHKEHAAAPAGPSHDPGFQQVVARVHGAAAGQRRHSPAAAKVAQAHAAAVSPPGEVSSQAADRHIQEMNQQQPRPFDRAAFKKALLDKIAATTPKTLGDAEKFKQSGKLASAKSELHGPVDKSKQEAAGPISQTATKPADASGIEPKPVTPMPPVETGAPPPDVGAAAAAPKPFGDADVSLQAGPTALNGQMSAAGVTEQQLQKSNEPAFKGALMAKQAATVQSATAPVAFRTEERTVLGAARADAAGAAQSHLGAMHSGRGKHLAEALARQAAAKQQDEQKRAEVARHIQGIYDKAKVEVEKKLKKLDQDVDTSFEAGATAAQKTFEDYVDQRMIRYKIDRYLIQPGGALLWAKDLLFDMPQEVNVFYEEGRKLYIAEMDHVLDGVAKLVETGLTDAKAEISRARTEIASYVAGLDPALREVGQKAAQEIGGKLDALEQDVVAKQDELIDTLAQKYNERLQQVDEKIAAKKAENRGLVNAAKEAVAGVIQTIISLKNMLLGVLSRAAAAINLIIEDPIRFLGNLVAGVKLGVQNFASRIGEHMKQGFMEWLFGAVAEAGIQLPKTFDLKGILSLVLQVLGLTYANIRSRAVAILGEKVVAALETAAEIFKKLITEGPAGLWEWIKEKLGDLKSMVLDEIRNFIIQRVIVAGVTWLIGLLNPASAFVKACKAIYDIIMFFVERGAQILALVNAVIDSVTAIAKGAIGGAATMVENALAKGIPVVIGFLAALLGLGGMSQKIKSVIETIRKPINAAIDWVIHQAVKLVKAAGKFIAGLFGGKNKEDKNPHADDPEKGLKVEAGLQALRQGEAERRVDGAISHQDALAIGAKVQREHPVFKSVKVKDGGGSWDYEYVASPSTKIPGDKKPVFENPQQIHQMIYDIAVERFAKERSRVAEQPDVASGGAQRIASVGPGEDPHILGSQIAARKGLSPEGAPFGKRVELGVAGEAVQARQGAGGSNIVIAGLGTYPEIAKQLEARGLSGPALAVAVEKFRKTGEGDVLVKRYVGLTFGAEAGRQVVAAAHAEFQLAASAGNVSARQLFGEGGISPVALVGFSRSERRLAAVRGGSAAPREGTKIGTTVQENLQRTVVLVYNAVKDRSFKDTTGLRTAILALLDQMDVAHQIG
jgi:hypothetical protein